MADSRAWPEHLGGREPFACNPCVFHSLLGWDSREQAGRTWAPVAFLHRGLLLWLLAWFFPRWTEYVLSVLSKRRFIVQKGCKTRDKSNQHAYPSCLSGTPWILTQYLLNTLQYTGPSDFSLSQKALWSGFLCVCVCVCCCSWEKGS